MPTFGFSYFLKLLSLGERPQRSQIRGRLLPRRGKGYDSHRSLRLAIGKLLSGEATLKELLAEASEIKQKPERRSYISGLKRFASWWAKHEGEIVQFSPGLFESPNGHFKVHYTPDFGVVIDGVSVAVHIWNTGSVDLLSRMVYPALSLFPPIYAEQDNPPEDLAVLSLRDDRLYRLSDVSDRSLWGARIVAQIDELFRRVRRELSLPPIKRDDQPPPPPP